MANEILHISGRQKMRTGTWIDTFRRYLTDSLTPEHLGTIMHEIDDGDIAAMCELSEEIESKDAHLQAVANTRRQAVTALEWSIKPEENTGNDDLALAVAEYCEDTLRRVSTFEETLEHLATAIGPGIAVSELVWNRGELLKTVDVPGDRLDEPMPGDVRVVTEENQYPGEPILHGKWIKHTPNAHAGFPMRVTLTRASAPLYVMKHYSKSDWSAFSEVFGMPIRGFSWNPEMPPTPDQRREAENMLKDMGSDQWYMAPENLVLQIHEANRGTHPYKDFIEWLETKQTILWLGQTLTTDVGNVGSFAAARVHDNVRATILMADLQAEARTLRSQLLSPMCRVRFPGKNVPVPYFERNIIEQKNLDEARLNLERGRFAQELGLPLSDAQWRELLDIPPLDGTPLMVSAPATQPERQGGPPVAPAAPVEADATVLDEPLQPGDTLLTPQEVNARLCVPRGRSKLMAKKGMLPCVKFPDGTLRFKKSTVDRLISEGGL